MQDSPDLSERLARIIEDTRRLDGPCLPVLQAIQADFGYVPKEAIPQVADALNLSQAEVYGVLTFYHDLRQEPPGRHIVRFCRAESCQAAGGEAIAAEVEERLGTKFGATAADGSVTLEAVYCLGNCALSPAAMIDDRLYGRATTQDVVDAVKKSGK